MDRIVLSLIAVIVLLLLIIIYLVFFRPSYAQCGTGSGLVIGGGA